MLVTMSFTYLLLKCKNFKYKSKEGSIGQSAENQNQIENIVCIPGN